MYKVYGKIQSRAIRVLWMLEEIGQPYAFLEAGPQSDAARALNPSGKIPVLMVDDQILTDSTAILTFLADRHGQLTYAPGTVERARQDALTQMLLDEFDSVLWTAARHNSILPDDKRVPEVTDSLKWEFGRNLDRLADHYEGPFLQGAQMTIADIICTHCLNWAFSAQFPVHSDVLKAYSKAMRGRDAYRRAQSNAPVRPPA